MVLMMSVFKVLMPMLYLVVWGTYLWLFYTDHPTARRLCTRFALVTVGLHTVCMASRGIVLGRLPMGAPAEFLCGLSLAMLATYLVIEIRIKAKNTGFLVTGVSFLLVFIGSIFVTTTTEVSPFLNDPGFAGHAVLVLFAYTAMSLSFLYALLYLILNRQLMQHKFGLLFRRLPSLETLERMSVGAVKLSVPLLFLSLCLGHLWMYDLADRMDSEMADMLSPWDPKILISWVILLGYSVGLLGNRFLGWRGKKMNVMAVAAFIAVVGAMGLVYHFFPSFHNFRSSQPISALSGFPDSAAEMLVLNEEAGR
ncbi:MAG: cytochrome c biogenesis protein CcsA [Candidatus Krumholzibacteriota bacterium]